MWKKLKTGPEHQPDFRMPQMPVFKSCHFISEIAAMFEITVHKIIFKILEA